jgi:glycosyltransferase involved in cell wall biosynthesis
MVDGLQRRLKLSLLIIRADWYNATPAIARAIEAGSRVFREHYVLCWDRTGQRQIPRDIEGVRQVKVFNSTGGFRSINMLIQTFRFQIWAFKYMRRLNVHYIQALDIESMLPAVLMAIIFRKKVIYDIRDPAAIDMRSLSYVFKLNGSVIGKMLDRLLYTLDWFLIGQSSGIILPNKYLIDYLGRWKLKKKLFIMPNTCHDYFQNIGGREQFVKKKRVGVTTMAYLGSTGVDRGSNILVELCLQNPQTFELYIAGAIRNPDELKLYEETGNIIVLGQLSYLDALSLICEVDAIPLLYNPEIEINRKLIPTKFYEAMMANTPVIVSKGMLALENEVISNNLGCAVNYKNSEEIKSAIISVRELNQENSDLILHKYYLDHFRLSKFISRYTNFYSHIINH